LLQAFFILQLLRAFLEARKEKAIKEPQRGATSVKQRKEKSSKPQRGDTSVTPNAQ